MHHKAALAKYCRQMTVARIYPALSRARAIPYLLTRQPLTLPGFYSSELQRSVRKAVSGRSYDRVVVYSSAMAQYLKPFDKIPFVMDLVDVDSDKWLQYSSYASFPTSAVYRREGNRLREYERTICELAQSVLVSTEREAKLLRTISGAAQIHVIPNGVDTDYFRPTANASATTTVPTVTFTGDMSYFPNEEAVVFFAREVLPIIRRSIPEVRFLIVGRNPGRSVLQLRRSKGVEVTGFVPDVRVYLAQTHVSVAPFAIACGIQNKILEALACGIPVVATPRAIQGLSGSVAKSVGRANSPEMFAELTVRLLRDVELAKHKGTEGRDRVKAEYSWAQNLQRLVEVVEASAGELTAPGFLVSSPRSRCSEHGASGNAFSDIDLK
jgi:polysaccharide biosynthesis protein PslH